MSFPCYWNLFRGVSFHCLLLHIYLNEIFQKHLFFTFKSNQAKVYFNIITFMIFLHFVSLYDKVFAWFLLCLIKDIAWVQSSTARLASIAWTGRWSNSCSTLCLFLAHYTLMHPVSHLLFNNRMWHASFLCQKFTCHTLANIWACIIKKRDKMGMHWQAFEIKFTVFKRQR